tara:strand:- start:3580 stop:4371 length:792 start_codon:yes stop_codon:yes gene_type:complete
LSTSNNLTSKEESFYKTEGFLVRENIFSKSEVFKINKSLERAASKALLLSKEGAAYHLDGKKFVDSDYLTVQFEPGLDSEIIRVIEPAHQLDEGLRELITDPRLVNPIQDIMGMKLISLWTDKLNLKRPKEGTGFGWHQDSPYWVHDSENVDLLPNVYLSLDNATLKNGCFKVIRRSHTRGCLPGTNDGTQLGGFYTDSSAFDKTDEVPLEISAGSLVFFNPHIVHGSEPNSTNTQRRAYIITYQPGGLPSLKSGEIENIRVR